MTKALVRKLSRPGPAAREHRQEEVKDVVDRSPVEMMTRVPSAVSTR
jgi:hypothetical protein